MHGVNRQKGSVILTVAFALLFLLGFMGIALDFGHLMVVRDEMQTSVDACALAAAQELDGAADALTRATNAGIAAGNLNNVNFQSGTWSGKGKIVATDITFKDASYGTTTAPANAKYAQCQHAQNGVQMWLLPAMGAFAGSTDSAYSSTKNVSALAVATQAGGQSACPIPTGLKPKGPPPDYGFVHGDWITVVAGQGAATAGEMGWYNLDGTSNANETSKELSEPGKCGITPATTLGTPGIQASVADAWNARFGIYKNANSDPSQLGFHPDYTGYAYTLNNWPVGQSAYDGSCPPSVCTKGNPANFKTKRLAFASYDDTGTSVSHANNTITGLTIQGGFNKLATPGAGGQHQQFGYSRRIVSAPVLDPSGSHPIGFVCIFLLQPMPIPVTNIEVEYLGNASDPASPCTTAGLAGGTGPKVPVLVQ